MWRKLLVLVLGGAVVGCSDDPEADNRAAAFIGTWKTTTATQETSGCLIATEIGDKQNVALTWTVTKSPDASADVILTSDARPTCALKAKIKGTQASLVTGSTCKVSFDATYDFAYTFNAASVFELGADGKTASVNLLASFDQLTKDGRGTGYTCAFTEVSPLTKS